MASSPAEWIAKAGDWYVPEPNSGCWLWIRSTSHNGYGQLSYNGVRYRAPRLAFEAFRGPIPEGLQIDHLCRTPSCVNPDHLELVTSRENTLRGYGPTSRNAKKTHCPKGHPLSGDSLYLRPDGFRECKECSRQKVRRRRIVSRSLGRPVK